MRLITQKYSIFSEFFSEWEDKMINQTITSDCTTSYMPGIGPMCSGFRECIVKDDYRSLQRVRIFFSTMLSFHTVRKSQIMSKNSIFKKKKSKLSIWIFELKSNDFGKFLYARSTWIIFAPKIGILCKYRINNNWKLLNFDNFWRENSKSNRNKCIINLNN